MTIFTKFEHIRGDPDVSGFTRNLDDFFALLNELRPRLGGKAYLLDEYVRMLLEAANCAPLNYAADDGFNAARELPRNIDRDNKCIHVTNAMTRVNGSPQLGPTKTPESVRTIPVMPEIMELLEARIRGENDYLFTNRVEGLMMNPRTFLKHYKKTLAEANVRYLSPHCCRHTFATRLFAAGVNPKIIQSLKRNLQCKQGGLQQVVCAQRGQR